MPFQKSLNQNFRKNNLTVASGWRAFFAPYNVTIGSAAANLAVGPTILDLMGSGPVTDASLYALGFKDIGWIKDVVPTPQTKIGQIRSGFHGAVKAQYKGEIGEQIEFRMREITRMSMKIASGSDVFNLLAVDVPTTTGPLSASGATKIAMSSYDPNGPTVTLASSPSGAGITVGSYIVVDKDYDGVSYGLVGENATPVFQGNVTDVDYIRKTSDFVNRVIAVNGNVVTLSQPFAGGGSGDPTGALYPQAGSYAQRIQGFAAREGGTFIEEWTGVFLLDTIDGAQFLFYYPHLSTMAFAGLPTWAIENIGNTDLTGFELQCTMTALAFDDPLDGHTVCAYRAFYPRARRQDIAI